MNQNRHTRRHGRSEQAEFTPHGPEGRGMGRRKQGQGCCGSMGQNNGRGQRGVGMGHEGLQGCCGGRGGGGGRERRGRLLNQGDLRLLALALIAEKPRHGYEIMKAIEDKTGGSYTPSPGVIYPTLTLLEELDHVSVTPDNGKKLHSITDEGRAYLKKQADMIKMLEERLATISEHAAQRPAPEIVRAMENLRTALQLRATRGPIDAEIAEHIAEVIDSLAGLIERET